MLDKRTLSLFFDFINGRDLDQLSSLLREDATFLFPKTQPLMGRSKILRFFRILFRQYPALRFTIRRIIVEGRFAAIHWTNRGTSRKGRPYENEGVTILEEEGGVIIWISDFFKDTNKF
jgi:ketosteroid isomerase-like protein